MVEAAGPVRVGDAERDAAAQALREHLVAGRLTLEEFSERVVRAYAAVTVRDLAALGADLPRGGRPVTERAGGRARRVRQPLWGRRRFSLRLEAPAPPQRVLDAALDSLAPALHRDGFELRSRDAGALLFVRERGGAVSRVVVSAAPGTVRGSRIDVYGVAGGAVRRAFAGLLD